MSSGGLDPPEVRRHRLIGERRERRIEAQHLLVLPAELWQRQSRAHVLCVVDNYLYLRKSNMRLKIAFETMHAPHLPFRK